MLERDWLPDGARRLGASVDAVECKGNTKPDLGVLGGQDKEKERGGCCAQRPTAPTLGPKIGRGRGKKKADETRGAERKVKLAGGATSG